jgi:hypothetical protein
LPKAKEDKKESHPDKEDEIDVSPFEVLHPLGVQFHYGLDPPSEPHPFPGEGDNPLRKRANRRGVIRAVKKV